MFIYLSHFINADTPAYGGAQSSQIMEASAIRDGASSNSKFLSFSNHFGTHIDFPRHFSDLGKSLNDYSPETWRFNSVQIMDIKVEEDQIIDGEVLNFNSLPKYTDMLLIRTGFEAKRNERSYWNNNPGLAPSLASDLKRRCPNLMAVGFDFISLSSYQNRPLGRKAHMAFLVENDILIIEDMSLGKINTRIINILALPLLLDDADGSPITILAEVEND